MNLVVIDKQPQLQYLGIEDAIAHCAAGGGPWPWAGNDDGTAPPQVVLGCVGDIATLETVAAAQIVRERLPGLRTRVVNVVDLMALSRPGAHPNAMTDERFAGLFTDDVDVVMAFHGFPGAIHQVLHGRPDAGRFHVRGYVEQGPTTTPFDMTVLNRISRFHLVMDALRYAREVPEQDVAVVRDVERWCRQRLAEHRAYVREHFEDLPEIRDWRVAPRVGDVVSGQQSRP